MAIFDPDEMDTLEYLEGYEFDITKEHIRESYVSAHQKPFMLHDYGYERILLIVFGDEGYHTNPFWNSISVIFDVKDEHGLTVGKRASLPYSLSLMKWLRTFPSTARQHPSPEQVEAVDPKLLIILDGVLTLKRPD